MNRKQYRLPVMILAIFFVSVFIFLAARPAAAIGSPWTRWKINLTFPNDNLDVQLTLQRGHTTQSGRRIIDDEVKIPLSCQSNGNPTIKNGVASFDGSSYFNCDMPSIQDKVLQLWSMSIPDACESKRPYVTGRVAIAGNPIDPNPDNPIFYRDDIQFNTPLNIAAQNATMTVAFGQAAAESSTFIIDPAGQKLTAYLARSGPASFNPVFVVDGSTMSATPATINQPAVLSNLETTIFFGYSPASGEYFEGSLWPTEIDPFCSTTG